MAEDMDFYKFLISEMLNGQANVQGATGKVARPFQDGLASYTPEDIKLAARAGSKGDLENIIADELRQAREDKDKEMPQPTMVRGMPIPDFGKSFDTGIKNYRGMMDESRLQGERRDNVSQYQKYMEMLATRLKEAEERKLAAEQNKLEYDSIDSAKGQPGLPPMRNAQGIYQDGNRLPSEIENWLGNQYDPATGANRTTDWSSATASQLRKPNPDPKVMAQLQGGNMSPNPGALPLGPPQAPPQNMSPNTSGPVNPLQTNGPWNQAPYAGWSAARDRQIELENRIRAAKAADIEASRRYPVGPLGLPLPTKRGN